MSVKQAVMDGSKQKTRCTDKLGRTLCDVISDYEDPAIKKMLQDPDHIERYVSPEDLAAFAAIKKEREENLAARQTKSSAQTAAAPQT